MKYLKILLGILAVILSLSYTYGQGQTYSKPISGTVKTPHGSYNYTVELNYLVTSTNYGESPHRLKIGFSNCRITSYNYDGESAAQLLTDFSFPVATSFQANINGVLKLSSGSTQISTNFFENDVSDVGMDWVDVSNSFREQIKANFGADVTYNDVRPTLSSIVLSNFAVSKAQDLSTKMQEQIRLRNEKNRLAEKAEKKRLNAIEKEEQERIKAVEDNSNNNSNQSNKTYTVAEIAAMEQVAKSKNKTISNNSQGVNYTEQRNDKSVEVAEEKSQKEIGRSEVESEQERALERERQREENERQRKQEKINTYQTRIDNQQKENDAIAAAAAASSGGALYIIGGIIYDKMGLPADDLYTGSNFHANFDIGYGFSYFPISFASERTGINISGEETSTKKNTTSSAITIDLRLALKLGYETGYGGGNIYGRFEPGFSPIFTDFNTSYGYGAEFFGGFKGLKLYGRYELGSNNFSTNGWLDAEEIGEGGKSSTKYKQIRAGLKFSFYRDKRTAKRDHLIFGIIENYFDENSAAIFSRRDNPDESSINIIEVNPNYIATGYFFEWKRDHTHRFYIEWFSNYPVTGEIGGTSNSGKYFIQAGFTRSIEGFFGI